MANKSALLEQFATMSHDDKYAKVLVYLDLMRQKTSEFVGLYGLVHGLGLAIDDDMLTEIYTSLVGIVEYGKSHNLDTIVRSLAQQKEIQSSHTDVHKKDQEEADILLGTL